MIYTVAIKNIELVEVEAATEDAAIELVKQKINYRPISPMTLEIVKESTFDEETQSYKIK